MDNRVTRVVALMAGNGAVLYSAAQYMIARPRLSGIMAVPPLLLLVMGLVGVCAAYLELMQTEAQGKWTHSWEAVSALTFFLALLAWIMVTLSGILAILPAPA